jgi:hypothetical protein
LRTVVLENDSQLLPKLSFLGFQTILMLMAFILENFKKDKAYYSALDEDEVLF